MNIAGWVKNEGTSCTRGDLGNDVAPVREAVLAVRGGHPGISGMTSPKNICFPYANTTLLNHPPFKVKPARPATHQAHLASLSGRPPRFGSRG